VILVARRCWEDTCEVFLVRGRKSLVFFEDPELNTNSQVIGDMVPLERGHVTDRRKRSQRGTMTRVRRITTVRTGKAMRYLTSY
jgi:hypothetical protein